MTQVNNRLTKKEFTTLLAQPGWTHEQGHHIAFEHEGKTFGGLYKVSRLGDISITYEEGFEYDDQKMLTLGTVGIDQPLTVRGLRVVDEKGEKLGAGDVEELLPPDFTSFDYAKVVEH